MNNWNGIGRLVRDPELRYSTSGVGVCTFTIAVDRRFKNAQGEREADFIQIKTFKQLAELVANSLSKGKLAGVSGALQISPYTDKDGNKKSSTCIMADEVKFLSPKDNGQAQQPSAGSYGHEVNLDDDIPF
jgi:single-strand DNA-binding protein